jgi:O-antigen/teichoic acid export membrane protein
MEFTPSLFVRQNVLGVGSQLAGFLSNIIFNIVLPIWMGATLFGKLSLTLGVGYFAVGLFDAGFNLTTMKFISRYYSKKQVDKTKAVFMHLLKLKLSLAILLAAVVYLSADFIANSYNLPELAFSFQLVSPLIISYALLTFTSSVFVGLQKNQFSLIVSVANSSLLIAFPLFLYWLGLGLNGVIIAVNLAYATATALILIIFFKKFKKIVNTKHVSLATRNINSDAMHFSVFSWVNLLLYFGIILILGFSALPDEVGFFKIALSLFSALGILIPLSNMVIFSSVIGLKSVNALEKMRSYMYKVFKYGYIIIFPMMFGLLTFSDKLIYLIYGPDFSPTAFSLDIMAFALLAQFVNGMFFTYLSASNKVDKVSKIYLVGGLIGLAFAVLATSTIGYLGAAISFVLIQYLILFMLYSTIRKDFKVDIFSTTYKPFLAALLMGIGIYFVEPYIDSLVTGGLLVSMAVIFYFIFLYLIKGYTKDDLKILRYLK